MPLEGGRNVWDQTLEERVSFDCHEEDGKTCYQSSSMQKTEVGTLGISVQNVGQNTMGVSVRLEPSDWGLRHGRP